jgi:serine phosphatase RsbU (regulator of sigma subunit)
MTQIPFEQGDRLVLYTDGITDGRNPDNAMLGVSGLARYLKETAHLEPKKCIAAIIRRIKDYRNGLPPDDDQLLLSISYIEADSTA